MGRGRASMSRRRRRARAWWGGCGHPNTHLQLPKQVIVGPCERPLAILQHRRQLLLVDDAVACLAALKFKRFCGAQLSVEFLEGNRE